jgi:hypothetical protein
MSTKFAKTKQHLLDSSALIESILCKNNAAFEQEIACYEFANTKEEAKMRDRLFKKVVTKFLEQDFFAWCQFFLPKHFSDVTPDFHYEIVDLLFDTKVQKMALAAPRGTAKSTVVSVGYALFNIVSKREPNIIIISVNETSAKKIMINLKNELTKNERIISFYGQKKSKEIWNEMEFVWDDTIVSGFGLGMPVRVSKFGHHRPTLALLDDIETRNVFTLIQSKDQEEWQQYKDYIYREVEPALDPKVGKVRFIGTVFHPDAILPYMMKSPDYFARKWSIIYKDDLGEEKSLWEERFPLEVLYKKRDVLFAQGQADVWMSEYMNEPVSKNTKAFCTPSKYSRDQFDSVKENLMYFQAFDLATGKGRDMSASIVIARDQENYNNIYVVDYFKERIEIDEAIQKILDQAKVYMPIRMITQKDLITMTNEKAIRAAAMQRKVNINLTWSTEHNQKSNSMGNSNRSKESKHVRIESGLQIWIKSGKLLIRDDMNELSEDIENFPFVRNDDLLDSLLLAVIHSFPSDKSDSALEDMEETGQAIMEYLKRYRDRIEEHQAANQRTEEMGNFGKWDEITSPSRTG